jgi:hypothetical protein
VTAVHLNAPVEALAISGNRVAYDVQSVPLKGNQGETPNRILVWNVGTGTTTKVSGKQTATADGMAVGGVDRLAIAGDHVAWRVLSGGNSELDDDIYSSSLLAPKERHVAGAFGSPSGAGSWLGGVVASGNEILVNRWTTDAGGAITSGGLYALHGTKLKPFADGGAAVAAVAADARRVAVEHYADSTICVFSATGDPLSTVTPAAKPQDVALSGRNLLVLEAGGKLVLYDAQTGALKKEFTLHRGWQGAAIAVHGDVAVYSTPLASRPHSSVRALNLITGKDALVGRLPGRIPLLRMDSFGLVYASDDYTAHGYNIQLVFRPFAEVAAAVR